MCISKLANKKYKYATGKAPYYMELRKLSSQLIVIYIFMTDGKKRLLKS